VFSKIVLHLNSVSSQDREKSLYPQVLLAVKPTQFALLLTDYDCTYEQQVQRYTILIELPCWKSTDCMDGPDCVGHWTCCCRQMGFCWRSAIFEGATTHSRLHAWSKKWSLGTVKEWPLTRQIPFVTTRQLHRNTGGKQLK